MEKLTMSVKEMSQQLGVSLPTAYDLTHVEGFPVIQVGRRKVIPIDGFRRWLETSSGQAMLATE